MKKTFSEVAQEAMEGLNAMTEPTYFARFANEAERELARRITALHVDDDYPWDAIFFNGPIRMAWRKDIGSDWVEIPFPEFIRRFVPLSVIGALAECHGMGLTSLGYLATHPAAQINFSPSSVSKKLNEREND